MSDNVGLKISVQLNGLNNDAIIITYFKSGARPMDKNKHMNEKYCCNFFTVAYFVIISSVDQYLYT